MMASSRVSGDGSPRGRRRPAGPSALVLAAVASFALATAGPASAGPLTIGFADPLLQSTDAADRGRALNRAVAARAGIARIAVSWRLLAPAVRPPGFEPSNPSSPGYAFSQTDAAVRSSVARGLRPLLTLSSAPDWAEGPNRPRAAPEGSWRPSPAMFGAFARAVARRYGGRYPDPLRPGGQLPRVHLFQAWNEGNISNYLTPQWARGRPASPAIFRRLVNALERGVHAVHRSSTVITGGTAPYGDPGHGSRMRPVRFLRAFFCLRGSSLRASRCGDPPSFDVLAHHPINAKAPAISALHPDDATTPDIGRIRRVLRAAERRGRAGGPARHPIWATEIWWGSRPPARGGEPLRRQARWMERALYLLWRQGVSRIVFLRLFDGSAAGQADRGYASGILTRSGRPKPSFRAVRFPLVADRLGGGRVRVWVRPPEPGPVRVQKRLHRRWRTIRRVRARDLIPFTVVVRDRSRVRLRAAAAGLRSLPWGVPAAR